MKTSTAYNHLERLRSRVNSIYSAAECYLPPHDEILRQLTEQVFNDPALAKCPAWVRQSLGDLSSHRLNYIQQNLVVWMFETESGVKTWDAMTEAERKPFCSSDKTGDHYWLKHSRRKFTGKAGDIICREYIVTDKKF